MTMLIAKPNIEGLKRLVEPRGVAVIGASTTPGKLGWAMADSLRGFQGPVLRINARNPDPGHGMYPTVVDAVAATGISVDVAVSCVPAEANLGVLLDAAAADVGAMVVCAGGFAEVGGAGIERQAALGAAARANRLRILGPNTSGYVVPHIGLTASFVPGADKLRAGPVAVVSSSGGVNHALAFGLAEREIGVRLAIGIGNGEDIDVNDVLELLEQEEEVRVVALHLESVADGRRLVQAVESLTPRIPVVALVAGQADVDELTRSHTGALATSWRTTRAALRQAGAVIVDDERELMDATATLSLSRLAPRPAVGVGIVTGQAGPGLLMTDALRSIGLDVPELATETVSKLQELLPPLTYQLNPVDTGRPNSTFGDVVRAVALDPSIDVISVYALLEPGAVDLPQAVAFAVAHKLPVVVATSGPPDRVRDVQRTLGAMGVPTHTTVAGAVVGIRSLVEDALGRGRRPQSVTKEARTGLVVADARLNEHEGKRVLHKLGIQTPRGEACDSPDAVRAAFRRMRRPVVLKQIAPSLMHKTDVGGIHLGIRTEFELESAITALIDIGATDFLVEETIEPGLDLLVAARRDPTYGPIVVLALGGVTARILDDVAVRLAPLAPETAATMIDDLRASALLHGWRGGPAVDALALGEIVSTLGDFLLANPTIQDIEVNPLRACKNRRLVALDVLVVPTAVPSDA